MASRLLQIILPCSILLLAGCKGRTMENVEPDGDTVEVTVNEVQDTVIIPSGTEAPANPPQDSVPQTAPQDSSSNQQSLSSQQIYNLLNQ